VPYSAGTGAGAESRQDIGWVIVGGLVVGTFFTLFVIPVVYTYLSKRVFMEADHEPMHDVTAPALPKPQKGNAEPAPVPAE
jgi:multidrug efflux pump